MNENTTRILTVIAFIILIVLIIFQGKIIIMNMENQTQEYCNELIENKTIQNIEQCNITGLSSYTTYSGGQKTWITKLENG